MPPDCPLADAHVRIARPTDQMAAVVAFYRERRGLEVLGSFEHHAGFDGVMLGLPALSWHFERRRRSSIYLRDVAARISSRRTPGR
jgi:hypothetical protein